MKSWNRWVWLSLFFAIWADNVQAGVVLAPVDGLSRSTTYGDGLGDWDGTINYDYTHDTNGPIIGQVDLRDPVGADYDSLLLYDLRRLPAGSVNKAVLSIRVDSAQAFSYPPDEPVALYLGISGTNQGTLGPESYTSVSLSGGVGIPNAAYGGGNYTATWDVTAALQSILSHGFDHVEVFLQTFESTTEGPSYIYLTGAPTLRIGTTLSPLTSAVPEPSSILSLGIAVLGPIGGLLFGRMRSFKAAFGRRSRVEAPDPVRRG